MKLLNKPIFSISFIILMTLISFLSADLWNLPQKSVNTNYYNNGQFDLKKIELGKLLFFDKILSGNKNISCAACHHPEFASGDGLSLPVGEGGSGLGPQRSTGEKDSAIKERVPRNSPALFNIGAKEYTIMFHDGRVEADPSAPSGFNSPAGDDLPLGLDNVIAAQAMFPVTSSSEMAGQQGENPQADYAASGNLPAVWDYIAQKLKNIPEYVSLFSDVYGIQKDDITYVHAANAIAEFEAYMFRSDNSPFDQYLNGDKSALSTKAYNGMLTFYGKGSCYNCHSGTYHTDQNFHSIAIPQIGPGKGDGFHNREDFGREKVTGNKQDRYKFRTPSLRNVALTAPYGHDGAYKNLDSIIRHHLDPNYRIKNYDINQVIFPQRLDLIAVDFSLSWNMMITTEISLTSELQYKNLSDTEINEIIEFLNSLTDYSDEVKEKSIPETVPSGLPVII